MNITTKLQASDILKKEFRTKNFGGYNPDEVDAYLDDIIQDYDGMKTYIEQLEEENKSLRKDILDNSNQTPAASDEPSLEKTIVAQPSQTQESESNATQSTTYNAVDEAYPSTTNYDILRRLSNLERKVFGEEKTTTESAQNFYNDTEENNSLQ